MESAGAVRGGARPAGGKLGLAVRAHLAWTRPDRRFGGATTLAAVKTTMARQIKAEKPWIGKKTAYKKRHIK